MTYLWVKAFHIIGMVVWFAGLFYLVRLFVYHVEANQQPQAAQMILKPQYELMEQRLYKLITTPGMIVTVVMAIALLVIEPEMLKDAWLHSKLGLVTILIGYHFYCGRIRRKLAADQCQLSSQQLRLLNEVPTVLLLGIVLLAVFKNSLPIPVVLGTIVGLMLVLIVMVQIYAIKRQENQRQLS